MNIKAIDAALETYRKKLTEQDRVRLSFFRDLWEVQNEIATQAKSVMTYRPNIKAEVLDNDCFDRSLLSQFPLEIKGGILSYAMERVAQCLIRGAGLEPELCTELVQMNWESFIERSPLEQAGLHPGAYCLLLHDEVVRGGGSEEMAAVIRLLASAALRGVLDDPAIYLQTLVQKFATYQAHPLTCPVCAARPSLARVGQAYARGGYGKQLWCGQCGTIWDFERIRCACCGSYNQHHLHYQSIQGDEAHRLARCDECGGYLRTVYQSDALAPFSFEVEDVVMYRLELIAHQN